MCWPTLNLPQRELVTDLLGSSMGSLFHLNEPGKEAGDCSCWPATSHIELWRIKKFHLDLQKKNIFNMIHLRSFKCFIVGLMFGCPMTDPSHCHGQVGRRRWHRWHRWPGYRRWARRIWRRLRSPFWGSTCKRWRPRTPGQKPGKVAIFEGETWGNTQKTSKNIKISRIFDGLPKGGIPPAKKWERSLTDDDACTVLSRDVSIISMWIRYQTFKQKWSLMDDGLI